MAKTADLPRPFRRSFLSVTLRILDTGRPYAVTETLMHRTLSASELPVTIQELRKQLAYLEGRGLVKLPGKSEGKTAR